MTFLNKSVIFYGPSGSGKTTLMKDLMYITRYLYPLVFAFAPTNYEKHDFDKLIPTPMIFEDFGLKDIKNIFNRQRAAASIYNTANDLAVLNKLFQRIADRRAYSFLERMKTLKKKIGRQIESQYSDEPAVKKVKLEEIEDNFKMKLIKFYKHVIAPKVKRLNNMNLSKEEQYAVEYIGFNPHTLLVFDDSTSELRSIIKEGKKKGKGEDPGAGMLNDFFFRGRWNYITHWYAIHDDVGIDPDIRKNAFYSIFTDKSTALGFFTKGANSFSATEKKKAEHIINVIFDTKKAPAHAKLVYSRLEQKFYYVVADTHEDFKMCAHVARRYCDKVHRKNMLIDNSNPYVNRFTEKLRT